MASPEVTNIMHHTVLYFLNFTSSLLMLFFVQIFSLQYLCCHFIRHTILCFTVYRWLRCLWMAGTAFSTPRVRCPAAVRVAENRLVEDVIVGLRRCQQPWLTPSCWVRCCLVIQRDEVELVDSSRSSRSCNKHDVKISLKLKFKKKR